MGYAYGHTVITCRNCRTVTVIDNKTLEVITEHICPECRIRMTDRELSRLKMHLFYLWLQMYDDYCGPMMELFDYDINLHPHCETESGKGQ